MKYTVPTIAKALLAFGITTASTAAAAAHGLDLSTLDVGEWLLALGAGFTAGGGVFATPNKSTDPAPEPVDQVVNGMEAVIAAHKWSTENLQRATQAIASAPASVPELSRMAEQIIGAANVRPPASLADRVIESHWQRPTQPQQLITF